MADVRVLAAALLEFYRTGRTGSLEAYSQTALRRIWKATRFSSWMTSMLHRFPDDDGFRRRVQVAELDYLTQSRAASASLAENYVGLPMEGLDRTLMEGDIPQARAFAPGGKEGAGPGARFFNS